MPETPINLILPFDCAQDWIVSWGYHHSTPQNRFAVDFATTVPAQPVYAAHAGTVYLKPYGTPDHLIDIGIAARVIAADGITSTVYGHLDADETFALWETRPRRAAGFRVGRGRADGAGECDRRDGAHGLRHRAAYPFCAVVVGSEFLPAGAARPADRIPAWAGDPRRGAYQL